MGFIVVEWDFIVIQWDIHGIYPLVNVYITIENGPVEVVDGNPLKMVIKP